MTTASLCAWGVNLTTLITVVVGSYQLYAVWKTGLRSASAGELLTATYRDRNVAGRYFVVSVVLLTCFTATKAVLLLKGVWTNSATALIAFGAPQGGGVAGYLGLSGVVVAVLGIYVGFRYLRATHYVQILFALRKELGLESRF